MSLPENDIVRLRHMLDADAMLRFALVPAIAVVGEGAAKVSIQTRGKLPGIAWSSIVGMRNRLVHTCFGIDSDVLWETVGEGLPPLAAQLRAALRGKGRQPLGR